MGAAKPLGEGEAQRTTLGDLLYNDPSQTIETESAWVALLASASQGDERALSALYDRGQQPVFTLALRFTGDRASAEEVTVDVFHEVWRRAGQFDSSKGSVLAWVMTIARSRAIDRLRFEGRDKRSGELPQPEKGAATDELLAMRAALELALRELSADERRAIEETYFSGLTHVEVAEVLREPIGTVKTRIRAGLQKLRGALALERNHR